MLKLRKHHVTVAQVWETVSKVGKTRFETILLFQIRTVQEKRHGSAPHSCMAQFNFARVPIIMRRDADVLRIGRSLR